MPSSHERNIGLKTPKSIPLHCNKCPEFHLFLPQIIARVSEAISAHFPTHIAAAHAGYPQRTWPPMRQHLLKAIALKIISAFLFAVMSALVRFLGEIYPVGEIVFFRASAAVFPVLVIYAWRRELVSAVRTARPFGHLTRGLISVFGMFCNFAALARIPIVDATALSFAAPLFMVALAAIALKERVRMYRWSAVIVGFLG